jgi:RNA polymerase sigma factor (sigma-70 family)
VKVATFTEDGNRQLVLNELYERHALQALRLAFVLTGNRPVAEDLMQEAFARAFDRLESIRDPEAFGGYIRATILNLARRRHHRTWLERRSLTRYAQREFTQATDAPAIDERDRIWSALQNLPYRQRAALVLRYYEDLSERDAADVLGVSLAALKGLVARGAKSLRIDLSETEGDEP